LDIPTSFYEFWKFKQFQKFKTIKNELKFVVQCQAETGRRLQCVAQWPASHGRPEGRLGHGLAARSSRGDGSRCVSVGMVTARGTARWRAHRLPIDG
jgi:hypothetical protein